jgi:alkylated DNA repair dioxygenase AlkB
LDQPDLIGFDATPPGFVYQSEFLTPQEETKLLQRMKTLPLQEAVYRQWQARRRIVSYGGRYDFSRQSLDPAPPIPDFLDFLRKRIAEWAAIRPEAIQHAVIAEYGVGTQLGWHRDVPQFDQVMGVSIAGQARMRLRPYPPVKGARAAVAIELARRSAYRFQGPARWEWQHAISPTRELRYSITFRTLRRREGDPAQVATETLQGPWH